MSGCRVNAALQKRSAPAAILATIGLRDESVQPLYPVTWNSNRYGFQWWVGKSRVGERTFSWIAGWGLGGQRVFVVPESHLVVAVNAGLYEHDILSIPVGILNDVLAAVRD